MGMNSKLIRGHGGTDSKAESVLLRHLESGFWPKTQVTRGYCFHLLQEILVCFSLEEDPSSHNLR